MYNIDKDETMHISLQSLKVMPDVDALFQHLSQHSQQTGSILFKLQHQGQRYSQLSIGVYHSSLCLRGRDEYFSITSFDSCGDVLLPIIQQRLQRLGIDVDQQQQQLRGRLSSDVTQVELNQRLQALNPMQIVRQCLFTVDSDYDLSRMPLGLYGCFAFDFVNHVEQLAPSLNDCLQDDDYVFYLPTKLFIVDHQHHITRLISLTPSSSNLQTQALDDLKHMHQALQQTDAYQAQTFSAGDVISDTSYADYCQHVNAIIEQIKQGDAFQVVYGRLLQLAFVGQALDVFHQLCQLNPSPYAFFMNDQHGQLVGCSPELALRVNQTTADYYQVEIHPIAGTRPRGYQHGKADPQLDQRYSIAMQVDQKELAEHTMLIDLARNDIAMIAKPGTTRVTGSFNIEKYSHVQHLVSKVVGQLDTERFDSLHAYLATLNMGTLTGAPKPSALNMIRRYEHNARGYFGGAFGFITPSGDIETSIIIRSIRFKRQQAYIRAAGGIVADSIAAHEWQETVNKANACVKVLQGDAHDN